MGDEVESFQNFIMINTDRLCMSLFVDRPLLIKLYSKEVLTSYEQNTIEQKTLELDKANTLFQILAQKVNLLPEMLECFRKSRKDLAANILGEFRSPNHIPLEQGTQGPPQAQQPSRTHDGSLSARTVYPSSSSSQAHKGTDVHDSIPSPPQKPAPSSTVQGSGYETSEDDDNSLADFDSSISQAIKTAVSAITGENNYSTGLQFRGRALIVNVIFEGKVKFRKGAKRDSDNLAQALRGLKFDVPDPLIDPTLQELKNKIQQWQKLSYADADSLLVAVMSHGNDKDEICTSDDKLYNIWDIVEAFNNENCGKDSKLKGKPKIFLFNCCRGPKKDKGEKYDDDSYQDDLRIDRSEIPTWTDMLVCFSTVDKYRSLRSDKGSWFIQTLCQALLDKECVKNDVVTLLNIVAEAMKTFKGKDTEKDDRRQICPYTNIGFTKKFFLVEN